MECMCAQTRPRFILSSERVLGEWSRTHVNSKGKIPSTGKIFLRGVSNPRRCIKRGSEPNTLPTSSCGPPSVRLSPARDEIPRPPTTSIWLLRLWMKSAGNCSGCRLFPLFLTEKKSGKRKPKRKPAFKRICTLLRFQLFPLKVKCASLCLCLILLSSKSK